MTHRSLTTALACALVAGSTAFAAMPAQAASVARVTYADLDLASAAGQRTLAHRLNGAASKVCPTQAGDWYAQYDCRQTALGRAHADLAKAGVTSF
jgi:UrcA family protein